MFEIEKSKKVDNFDKVKLLMKFEDENDFYFLQILQRKKDNDWMTWNNRVIKNYYIHSMEYLEKRYWEIKELCHIFNARAYIRLSRRNTVSLAKDMIVELWSAFKHSSFNHLRKIYDTCIWRSKWKDKLWIIDIDWDWTSFIFKCVEIVEFINSLMPEWDKFIDTFETPNWFHIITKPFDVKAFKEKCPDIDIHKNNPTVLYCV